MDREQQRLTAFQSEHGILSTPQTLPNGEAGETQHSSTLLEVDELGRQMVAVTADRILREAEYRPPRRVIGGGDRFRSEPANRRQQLRDCPSATDSR